MGDRVRRFRAPGRVNLIGDHTDYNDGLVLPMAVDRDCLVTRRSTSGPLIATSLDGESEALRRFVDATVTTITRHGAPVPEGAIEVSSDVPISAGLSSSAALSVSLMRALSADVVLGNGRHVDPIMLARWARDAEELATGVASGLMDQLASACGVAGHVLLIDCADASVSPIELPARLGIVVVHSGISRTVAATAYAQRRAACEEAARRHGLRTLRAASLDQVAGDPLARHVVSENARVLAAADALRSNDLARLATLMLESHASLRDDFDVSTPELDRLVELLVAEGALGARLTGAGFGGCVIGIGRRSDIEEVAVRAARRYERETTRAALLFVPQAVDGASELGSA